MNVERSEPRQREQLPRQDASIRGEHDQVKRFARKPFRKCAQRERFVNAQSKLERGALEGTRREPLASSRTAIRLGDHAGELRACRRHAQARHRKSARTEKQRFHAEELTLRPFLSPLR
jgi:hypothetical protein